jgi:hypothetical protein
LLFTRKFLLIKMAIFFFQSGGRNAKQIPETFGRSVEIVERCLV